MRGSRSERTPPPTRTSDCGDLTHRKDDAEIRRGADVEHRERKGDAGQAVADRGDHGAAEQQPEVALLERAKVLSQPHDSGQPSSTQLPRLPGSVRHMLFGAHVSSSGGIWTAIDRGQEIGCDAVQVFTQSPRMWRPTNHTPEAVAKFRERREEAGIGSVVCHALYLVNLASPDPVIYEKSITAMRASLEAADAIGAEGVIFHVGSHLGAGFDVGLEQIVPALRGLLELTTDDLWLLMENSAGTGGTIGRSTDELAAIHAALDHHPRLGVCLDSCHWYASGVDVTDAAVLDAAVADLDRQIGLDRLRCLHVNDSKEPLGSNRDRHDSIGAGLMGQGLHTFLAHPAFQELPAILETPGPDGHGPDAAELERLRKLHAGREGQAHAESPDDGLKPWPRRLARSVVELREDAEARARDRHLVELGIAAADLVAPLLVARLDLGVAHRQRRLARHDGAEPAPPGLRRPQQVEVDLDVEHPLHAPHVRVAERLVGVDERARSLDAGTRVDDLVAVDLAAPALDLVLRPQGQLGGCCRQQAVGHLRDRDSTPSTLRKT